MKNIINDELLKIIKEKGMVIIKEFISKVSNEFLKALQNISWQDIFIWIKKVLQKIIKGAKKLVIGFKFFVQKTKNKFAQTVKTYAYENDFWEETTTTREMNNIPDEMSDVTNMEQDYTEVLTNIIY